MNSIFNQLLNVKGAIIEDAHIVDSPLRPEPVLEVRVRPRAGMLRCSRCGKRRHGYDRGGGVRSQHFLKGQNTLVFAWIGAWPAHAATESGAPVTLPSPDMRRDGSGVDLTAPIAFVG